MVGPAAGAVVGPAVVVGRGLGRADGVRVGVVGRVVSAVPYIRTVLRCVWPGSMRMPEAVTRWPYASVTRTVYGPGPAPESMSQ